MILRAWRDMKKVDKVLNSLYMFLCVCVLCVFADIYYKYYKFCIWAFSL